MAIHPAAAYRPAAVRQGGLEYSVPLIYISVPTTLTQVAVARPKHAKMAPVKMGDLFAIPVPDGRHGHGQVIIAGTPFYAVIFAGLYDRQPEFEELVGSDILLVGWTLNALLFHREWSVVGNRLPLFERIPFPSYKVLVDGTRQVHDFTGRSYRAATGKEWELLDNKTTVAPIRYQNALLAHHSFGKWSSDYEALTVDHARRRVLDNDGASVPRRH